MFSSLLFFIVTISIVVVFHELGHYFAARLCGVHVERFSLGFGKVLLRRRDRRGTEWVISALPLGGYVKPLAEADPSHPQALHGSAISEKNAWQRLLIFAAGPAFSLLLGIFIYAGTYMAGSNVPQAILGAPGNGTPAQQSGIKRGDIVKSLNGVSVSSWSEFQQQLIAPMILGQTVTLGVETQKGAQAQNITLPLLPAPKDLENANLAALNGLQLEAPSPAVSQVIAGGAGEAGGLQTGDLILQAGQEKALDSRKFVKLVEQHADQPLRLVVKREQSQVHLTVTPRVAEGPNGAKIGKIGVALQANYPMVFVRYGLFESVGKATARTLDTAWFSVKMLLRMITGEVSWRNISGPVTIADYAGKSASLGLERFIEFVALITISIGVLNLVPIPGLDGGQMLFAIFEIIRGRPLPQAIQEKGLALGYMLLLALMALAFFNDILRVTN